MMEQLTVNDVKAAVAEFKALTWDLPAVTTENHKSNFLGTFAKFRKATINFFISVCPSARNNSAPTGRIFMKFDI
jgi:hypothetical protein